MTGANCMGGEFERKCVCGGGGGRERVTALNESNNIDLLTYCS